MGLSLQDLRKESFSVVPGASHGSLSVLHCFVVAVAGFAEAFPKSFLTSRALPSLSFRQSHHSLTFRPSNPHKHIVNHNNHQKSFIATMSSSVIKNYFDNPTFSDLTILLSDRRVNTHRIVLCRKSEYFKTILTGHFKVCLRSRYLFVSSRTDQMQESDAEEIELHEDDPQAIIALLRHIYDLPYQRDSRDGGEK
jgi:hypothetical protein